MFGRLFWNDSGTEYWLRLPTVPSLIIVENQILDHSELWAESESEIYSLKLAAAVGLKIRRAVLCEQEWFVERREGNNCAIWLIKPKLFRGQCDSARISPPPASLIEKYCLSDKFGVDSDHLLVKKIAQSLLDGLPVEKRENPWYRAQAAFNWVKRNISYSIVPRSTIEKVARVIDALPAHKKNNPFSILSGSYDVKEDILRRVAANLSYFPPAASSFEQAKEFLIEVNKIWKFFQLDWVLGNCNASVTIEAGMGKCVGIANVFSALCRALGVPALRTGGYYRESGFGERHAWALVYFHPYGWREVDPTNSEFLEGFDHQCYGQEFHNFRLRGKVSIIPGKYNSPNDIERWRKIMNESQHFSIPRLLGLQDTSVLSIAEEILKKQ